MPAPTDCTQTSDGQAYETPSNGWQGAELAGDEHIGDPGRLGERLLRCPRRARGGDQDGRSTAVLFVVREKPERRAQILVHVPVNTWQACNQWGGKSLYDINSEGGRANRVSLRAASSTGLLPDLGVGDTARPLPRAGGLRRRLPDRRRHAPRSRVARAPPARGRRWARRVLDERNANRVRRRARRRHEPRLHRREHRLLADLVRRGTGNERSRSRQGTDRPLPAVDSAGAQCELLGVQYEGGERAYRRSPARLPRRRARRRLAARHRALGSAGARRPRVGYPSVRAARRDSPLPLRGRARECRLVRYIAENRAHGSSAPAPFSSRGASTTGRRRHAASSIRPSPACSSSCGTPWTT